MRSGLRPPGWVGSFPGCARVVALPLLPCRGHYGAVTAMRLRTSVRSGRGGDQAREYLGSGLEQRLRLRVLDLADVLAGVPSRVVEHALQLDRVVSRIVLGVLLPVGHLRSFPSTHRERRRCVGSATGTVGGRE